MGLFAAIIAAYLLMFVIFATLTPMEILAPQNRTTLIGRLRGLLFWVLWIPISIASFQAGAALASLIGLHPIVTLPIGGAIKWSGVAAIILGPILGAVFADFFFYWFHRAQHRWLWRYHAVHHSIRELSAVNSYHHVTESAFRVAITVIPASLFVADIGPTLAVVGFLLQLQIVYLHSPTKANFGPLRLLIADNRYHRIHHSLEERHFDKNFAAVAPLWDWLFGTAYWPAKDEWPAVGLTEIDEPQSVREFLDLPFRFGRRKSEAIPAE